MTKFEEKVYQATSQIPRGKVATYKMIAKLIGVPGAARATGNALNKNPFAPRVPCHRIVKSDLSLGGFASGPHKKTFLLRKEGVQIINGKIKKEFLWDPKHK